MRSNAAAERRRHARDARDPHYDAFHDRRQPEGTVATWVTIAARGGVAHSCRARVHYRHYARVLSARADGAPAEPWVKPPGMRTTLPDFQTAVVDAAMDLMPAVHFAELLGIDVLPWQREILHALGLDEPVRVEW